MVMSARRAATSMAWRSTETVVILPVRGDQIRAAMLNACGESGAVRSRSQPRRKVGAQRVNLIIFFFFETATRPPSSAIHRDTESAGGRHVGLRACCGGAAGRGRARLLVLLVKMAAVAIAATVVQSYSARGVCRLSSHTRAPRDPRRSARA